MLTEREMSTKVCSKCKEVKLFSEFHKKKASKDGYRSECKACVKEHSSKYYASNPEKVKKKNVKWCAANPEKVKKSNDKYRAANSEKKKEYDAKYYAANPEKVKKSNAKWCADNPEKVKEIQAKYRAAHPEKERDRVAKYRAANPEKCRVWTSNRRAVKLEAIPKWLAKEDYKVMDAITKEADRLTRETGVKYEVDHIHPLQPTKVVMFEGEMIPLICAFHCPQNLQILTRSENRSKGNKFKPYVESEI